MGNAKESKIAIISPYLDILGGGERFLLSIAEYYSQQNQVTIFWNDPKIKLKAEEKLGVDLRKTLIQKVPRNSLALFKKLLDFDYLFYMTDGSLFYSPCQKNYLIIQSPVHIPNISLLNKLKMSRITEIICYSEYVAKFIRTRLRRATTIIPPPVLTDIFKPKIKEKIILSVGRFFPWLHSKKQEVLIEGFSKFYKDKLFQDWKLVLIGTIDRGGEEYYQKIKKKTVGLPVEIITGANLSTIRDYYGRASIYWHAAGYGEDLNKYPQRAEHFGITTVEAMSAGCIPIVFNAGGQKEIINDGVNGFIWDSLADLLKKTSLIVTDKDKYLQLSKGAVRTSKKYSKENFISKITKLTE